MTNIKSIPFMQLGDTELHVTITLAEYNKLIRSNNFLNALYAAGVDSWEGYSEAQNMMDDDE